MVENLPVNTSAPLNIGVNPEAAGSNGQHFQGRMDDVRLYGIALGIEDVQLIYKGEAHMSSLQNSAAHGTVHKATTPTLPVFADLNLTYGQKIIGLDLGEQPGLTYALTGLPSGLSNRKTFVPNDIPGILAWYAADRNGSFDYYPDKNYDRNDSFFTGDLVLGLSFDESNGSLAYDSTGNANHAHLLNPGQWSAGMSGGGVSFDGDNDGVFFSKVGFMNQPSAFSFSLWFKRNSDLSWTSTNHGINNVCLLKAAPSLTITSRLAARGRS